MAVAALAVGCLPEENPRDRDGPAGDAAAPDNSGRDHGAQPAPSVKAAAESATLKANPLPLYYSPAERKAWVSRMTVSAEARRDVRRLLRIDEALSRPPASAIGLYITYAPPPNLPSFAPAGSSPHFRRLLGEVQAARDLAAAWAVDVGAGGGAVGVAEGLRRDVAGAHAVAAIRRLTGPDGLRPIAVGRQAVLELGVAVPTLYMAADLVWDHPAWRDGTSDARMALCRWADALAASLQGQLPPLHGLSLAWGSHAWMASLAMADRLDGTGRDHAERLRRAMTEDGAFGLSAMLKTEIAEVGAVPAEQWQPDGVGRSVFALAGWMMSTELARRRLPELFAPPAEGKPVPPGLAAEALIRKGLEYQFARLPLGVERPGAPADPNPVPAEWLVGKRHPQSAWLPLIRRRFDNPPWAGVWAGEPTMGDERAGLIGPAATADDASAPRPLMPVYGPLMALFAPVAPIPTPAPAPAIVPAPVPAPAPAAPVPAAPAVAPAAGGA